MAQSSFNVLNGSGLIHKDGQVNWAAARDAVSGTISTADNVASAYSTYRNPSYDNSRFFMGFNVSLPGGAIITGARIHVFVVSRSGTDAETLNVVAMTSGDPASLQTTDYVNVGSTSFGTLAYGSANTGAYNDIILDANGLANISLSGTSKFAFRTSRDISNTAPTVDQSGGNFLAIDHSSASGADNILQLIVEYTPLNQGDYAFFM